MHFVCRSRQRKFLLDGCINRAWWNDFSYIDSGAPQGNSSPFLEKAVKDQIQPGSVTKGLRMISLTYNPLSSRASIITVGYWKYQEKIRWFAMICKNRSLFCVPYLNGFLWNKLFYTLYLEACCFPPAARNMSILFPRNPVYYRPLTHLAIAMLWAK